LGEIKPEKRSTVLVEYLIRGVRLHVSSLYIPAYVEVYIVYCFYHSLLSLDIGYS